MTTTTDRLRQLAAEYQRRADGLLLAAEELNGHHTKSKQRRHVDDLQAAIELRAQLRPAKAAKPKTGVKGAWKQQREKSRATALKKARVVAEILKDKGPLDIADLSAAAREAGVPSLTGIYNYIKAGYITRKKHGKARGKHAFRYAFKALPEAEGASAS